MASLSGRVVVITGASSGIGAATAVALAEVGAKLVLGARRVEKLESVAQRCRKSGTEVVTVVMDVAKREECFGLVRKAVEKFGRVDVMLANAGYGFLAKVEETTDAQFEEIVTTNVKGTWWCMQAAAEVMRKQEAKGDRPARVGRGHILAVSSGAARRGLPLYGMYAMTKAAQLSLCEAMRVELQAEGIYVSTIHPLTTATEFFEVASSKSQLRSTGLGHAQPVEVVARKIVQLIRRPRPELWPVWGSNALLSFATLFPRIGDWAMGRTVLKRTRV